MGVKKHIFHCPRKNSDFAHHIPAFPDSAKYHESPVMGFLFSGNVKIKYHNEAPVIISRSVKYFVVFVLPMAISDFPASSLMIFLSMSHRSR